MEEKKKNKKIIIIAVCGITLMIAIVASIVILNINTKNKNKESSKENKVETIAEEEKENVVETNEVPVETAPVETPIETPQLTGHTEGVATPQEYQNVQKEENKQSGIPAEYNGFATVGKIEIPKTGVNLPILRDVSIDGMEIATCLLYESGKINQSGNTVIIGHNYRNGKLFSNNGKLEVGDKIIITTLDNTRKEYTIYNKYLTTSTDTTEYTKITDGPEIVLSTCDDTDEEKRIIIVAK